MQPPQSCADHDNDACAPFLHACSDHAAHVPQCRAVHAHQDHMACIPEGRTQAVCTSHDHAVGCIYAS